ncbi:hypothetical protein L1987_83712 [Smallanthus sonchifolius]|uniref:Uncharacterized protein n=1 Tax=Smallanthus sonchifolius TaxID=185202 RepID=A0ACB8YDD8_9ASTR|nr:hypothetical protein L1987_83712 [Smallanthus sonchifolius]
MDTAIPFVDYEASYKEEPRSRTNTPKPISLSFTPKVLSLLRSSSYDLVFLRAYSYEIIFFAFALKCMFADFIHLKSKAIEEICNRMASWMKFMHTEGSVLLLVEALLESAWRLCKFSVIFGELWFRSIFLIWQICGAGGLGAYF